MALQFKNKVSVGHVISIATMLVGGAIAYADLRGDLNRAMTDKPPSALRVSQSPICAH